MAQSERNQGVELKDVRLHEEMESGASSKEIQRLKKKIEHLNIASFVVGTLAVIALAAFIAILIIHINDDGDDDDEHKPKTCGQFSGGTQEPQITVGEPDNPGPFHDVTVREIKRIQEYLMDQNLLKVKPQDAKLNDSYLFTIDLHPPNKAAMLKHLDQNGNAPQRYANVILFRGDLDPPVIEERICGPLNAITSCSVDVSAPFAYRPVSSIEQKLMDAHLIPKIQNEFGHIIRESFSGSWNYDECEDDCLNWWPAQVPANNYGDVNIRKMWLMPTYYHDYSSVFSMDMLFFCNVDGTDPTKYSVEKVWYSGEFYEKTQDLIDAYAQGNVTFIRRTYPTEEQAQFASLTRKGNAKPKDARRPPELIEPDGKRYSIKHRAVEYLDMWKLHFRMSPIYGLTLYDIRFLDERFIYELSLQELTAIYSGSNPIARNQMFVDSAFSIGGKAKALVPGTDCPNTATFLPITITSQEREEPAVFKRAVCIFEQNHGIPLRRHHSYSKDEGANYGGMLDSALVLRSIHAVDNYDYIVDFTFHQNGALGASVTLTGYLFGNAWTQRESHYGFQIQDFLYGPMHHHLGHFKVDLDVGGSTSNQYGTLDIKEETTTLRGTNPPRDFTQIKFDYSLKETEQEAAYQYEFDRPMDHIIFNNRTRNKYDVAKAYRIVTHSKTKLLLKEDLGPEPAVSWARYQLAVTKRKEDEQRSASYLSQFDTINPRVSFKNFIGDNESIVDEDLVVWVSIGTYHIPHAEDLPVTSTAGKSLSFHIMPYNYFPECPSMASTDAVHIKLKDSEKPEEGLGFDFYGTGDVTNAYLGGSCTHKPFDMTKMWRDDPDDLFEVNYNKGVY